MNLPTEIERHILSFVHPYHLNAYSQTCKLSHEICLSLLPELLTRHCNTNEKLSFANLIELSLIYSPIPEMRVYAHIRTTFESHLNIMIKFMYSTMLVSKTK